FARRGNLKDSIAVHILNNTPAALVMLLTMFQ
ncbi:CPBP family intramembrane metalloprotease, partial [Streptococcus agalactiae]|nr:CPBP family intramembrane metalloprotease [Streptococcus agalactiae]